MAQTEYSPHQTGSPPGPDAPSRGWRRPVRLLCTGFAMGTADVVPGVSGGTIAFISGIYTELLRSIKHVTSTTPRLLLRGKVREAIAAVPIPFLLPLLLGIVTAGFSLASLISWLLANHPIFVWAFFFGLVAASVVVVLKRVGSWSMVGLGLFATATVAALTVAAITTLETPATPIAFFISGCIAICAMILPGLSGSFLLILMGKYDQVLDAVAARDIITLLPFFFGAVVGLALFSRLLTWLLARYHDAVILLLAGLMLGSLPQIWPWKEPNDSGGHGVQSLLQDSYYVPASINPETLLAGGLLLLGAFLIVLLDSRRLAMSDVEQR